MPTTRSATKAEKELQTSDTSHSPEDDNTKYCSSQTIQSQVQKKLYQREEAINFDHLTDPAESNLSEHTKNQEKKLRIYLKSEREEHLILLTSKLKIITDEELGIHQLLEKCKKLEEENDFNLDLLKTNANALQDCESENEELRKEIFILKEQLLNSKSLFEELSIKQEPENNTIMAI